ncbi:MAG: DUF1573 domain-containing protein [Candidatus Omnitrophica bacterium]|nr:DUF1573 domain-containing protein [Candidatus Omnitrophota bacterium]
MKCAAFILLLFVLIGFPVAPALSQPQIELDSESHNFGTSYPNQVLHHDFVFLNKGDKPLEILNVSTTCGCTAALLSATTILPSATGIASVTLVTGAPRIKKERATLTTNDPRRPKVALSVETDVRNMWLLTPKSSFIFTELPFDSQQTMELTLKQIDGEPFKVKAVSVKEPELSVKVGEPANNEIQIILTVNAGREKKVINDNVMVLTDYPKQPHIQIPVFGRIVGYIRFNRQRVFFGTMHPGEEKKIEVSAKLTDPNADPYSLKILDIQSEPNLITGTFLGMRGDGQLRIELTYKAPMEPGYQTGTITFKSNQESEPVSELPFSVLIRPKK